MNVMFMCDSKHCCVSKNIFETNLLILFVYYIAGLNQGYSQAVSRPDDSGGLKQTAAVQFRANT